MAMCQKYNSLVEYSEQAIRSDMSWLYVYKDVVPTFIEDKRLYDLFSSTKVPNIDLREILKQLPHLTLSVDEYERQFDSSTISIVELKRLHDGIYSTKTPERYTAKYMNDHVKVHILSGCLFIPREINKYCISFYSKWFEDTNTGGYYFDDIAFDSKGSTESGTLNDILYVSTGIDSGNGTVSNLVCGMNHRSISRIINDPKKFEKSARITDSRDGLHESNDIMKIYNLYKFVLNYIYYLNTYPNLLTNGLPEQDVFKNGSRKLEISKDIDFDLLYKSKSMHSNGAKNSSSKCPHYRSGFYRVLNSDFFKSKRHETVYVAPTFIHKNIFSDGEDSFKTVEITK